jgi:hypothetical protein
VSFDHKTVDFSCFNAANSHCVSSDVVKLMESHFRGNSNEYQDSAMADNHGSILTPFNNELESSVINNFEDDDQSHVLLVPFSIEVRICTPDDVAREVRLCTPVDAIVEKLTAEDIATVPIKGPIRTFGDNQSVVNSSSFHRVRKAIAAKLTTFSCIVSGADILSKDWNYSKVWQTLKPILFWGGERYYGGSRQWVFQSLKSPAPLLTDGES